MRDQRWIIFCPRLPGRHPPIPPRPPWRTTNLRRKAPGANLRAISGKKGGMAMYKAPLSNEVEEAVADLMVAARRVVDLTSGLVVQNKVATEYLRHGKLTRYTERMIA